MCSFQSNDRMLSSVYIASAMSNTANLNQHQNQFFNKFNLKVTCQKGFSSGITLSLQIQSNDKNPIPTRNNHGLNQSIT